MILEHYYCLVLFSTVFVNLKIVMADTHLDWKTVIDENIEGGILTKKLKEVLLDSPVDQPKDVEVDDTPPKTGLFNRFKSFDALKKDIGQNRDVILKPLALLEKMKSSVVGKEAEDGENVETTPNISNNVEDKSSILDKLTNTATDFTGMDKKGENVEKSLKNEEKSSNLGNQDSRSILDELRNNEKEFTKTNNEEEKIEKTSKIVEKSLTHNEELSRTGEKTSNLGKWHSSSFLLDLQNTGNKFIDSSKDFVKVDKTSKIDEKSSTTNEKSENIQEKSGDSESSVAKTLVKEMRNHERVKYISKNIDNVPSFLKNIESKVIDNFGEDKDFVDTAHTRSGLSLIEKMKAFPNSALGSIINKQKIENYFDIDDKSSVFENIEDFAARKGLPIDKLDDQQFENPGNIGKQPDLWLFRNMENNPDKMVEETENIESSSSNLNESFLTNRIREGGNEDGRDNRGEKIEKREGENDEKEEEEVHAKQDAIEIPRTLHDPIFKAKIDEAIWKVNDKDDSDLEKNEENLEKKTLFPPLSIRVFSVFDVDELEDSRNGGKIDKIGDKSSTQATIIDDQVDSKNDSIFRRILDVVWSNIRFLLKFLVEILKIYCDKRKGLGFENNGGLTNKKKVYLPVDLEVFPTFEIGNDKIDSQIGGMKDAVTSSEEKVDNLVSNNIFKRIIKMIVS